MSSVNETHPSPDDLIAFSAGKFDSGLTTDTILQHLDTCEACRRIVAGLSGSGFQDRLREARSTLSSSKSVSATSPSGRKKSLSSATTSLEAELANNPDYEGLVELGRGGMGVVYKVHNKLTGRDEVLKVMGKEIMSRPGAEERFRREIQSAARLDHTNIVRAYTARSYGEWLVFSMEFVSGDDLGKHVGSRGPLPVINACYYVLQVANGLQHAHEKGMVHRDIKPANLILHRDGKKHTVKILDFGLAKMTSETMFESGLTGEGKMLGTPDYVAPEQIVDAKSADIRADIYSLGCTLYFLLTGSAPFSASSLYELLRKHKEERAPMLHQVRPDVPEELAAVVARMMAKDPKQRYQTPADVAKAVGAFTKSGAAPAAPRTDPAPPTGQVPPQVPYPMTDELAGIWSAKTRVPDAMIDPPLPNTKNVPSPPVERDRGRKRSAHPEHDDLIPAAAARRGPPWSGIPMWIWPVAGGGTMFVLMISCCLYSCFRPGPPEGVIVLENLPTNAEVQIDGALVSVIRNGEWGTIKTNYGGVHALKVMQPGKELYAGNVTINLGGEAVRIKLPTPPKPTDPISGQGKDPKIPPTRPTPPTPPTPPSTELVDTVEMDGITYKLKDWKRGTNNSVIFTLELTNHKADRSVFFDQCYAIDEEGDRQRCDTAPGPYNTTKVPHEIPLRFTVTIIFIAPTAKKVPFLEIRISGQSLVFRNIPLSGATAPVTTTPPVPPILPTAPTMGSVVVKGDKLGVGVSGYLEVDGKRIVDWQATAAEMTLSVSPGQHKVILRTRFKMGNVTKYFKKEFDSIDVPAGGEKVLIVDAVSIDPEGAKKW